MTILVSGRVFTRATLVLVVCASVATGAVGQEGPQGLDRTTNLFLGFDPTPSHPFGRWNPLAPPELRQFEFMLGEFDCSDRFRQADGGWKEALAIWNATYFLNGHGIQDRYWTEGFATSNVRIYDPKRGKWIVTFFRMPGYQSGTWEGEKEHDTLVMRQRSEAGESRLTFYDVSEDGFRWKAEFERNDGSVSVGWTSVCHRRR